MHLFGLHTLQYTFRYKQYSDVLEQIIPHAFPQLASIAAQLLAQPITGTSQGVPTVLHYIFKSYQTSIQLRLSAHQQSAESLVPWGRLLFQMINTQIPKDAVPEDEEEREKCEWWKAKKWAFATLGRLFHRYGLFIPDFSVSIDLKWQLWQSYADARSHEERLWHFRPAFCNTVCSRNLQDLSAPS